mgnify:CR=1 FL=1
MPNKFYKDDDEYLEALSNIMKSEYEEIVSNNINLQLDCPDLALARHMTFKDLTEVEFLKRAEKIFSTGKILLGPEVDEFELKISAVAGAWLCGSGKG